LWIPGPGSGATSRRADGGAGPAGGRHVPEEVELKLTVLDPVAIRVLVLDPASSLPGVRAISAARTLDLEDRYLDTADGALRAAGLVARVRSGSGPRRLTVKSRSRRGQGAVHRRLELEGDTGDTGDDPRAWPPSEARDLLVASTGNEPLTTLATLRQQRLQRDVTVGASVVEVSLDEIEVDLPSGAGERWIELECELRSGAEADLAALGAALLRRADLVPATTSKLERALAEGRAPFTKR
jgi:inorganic triphosphatase YgiF